MSKKKEQSTVFLTKWNKAKDNESRKFVLQEFIKRNISSELLQTFSTCYPRFDPMIASLMNTHSGFTTENTFAQLKKYRAQKTSQLINSYMIDVDRFDIEHNFNQLTIIDSTADACFTKEILNNPEKHIQQGKIIKSGQSTTVALLDIEISGNRKKFFIKRYNQKNILHTILRSFIPSRAQISWQSGHLLKFLGINTPRPLAIMERRFGIFRGKSYIINEYLNSVHSSHYFSEGAKPDLHWPAVLNEIENVLFTLKRTCIIHGDLKAQNFIIHNHTPYLVDLDAFKVITPDKYTPELFSKDISRFSRSWINDPDAQKLFEPVINRLKIDY